MTDEKLNQAAREFAGGIQIGAYSSQDDKYISFYAGATWQAEQDRAQIEKLREALRNMPCTCVEANPLSGIMVDEVCSRCKMLDELSEEIADE